MTPATYAALMTCGIAAMVGFFAGQWVAARRAAEARAQSDLWAVQARLTRLEQPEAEPAGRG